MIEMFCVQRRLTPSGLKSRKFPIKPGLQGVLYVPFLKLSAFGASEPTGKQERRCPSRAFRFEPDSGGVLTEFAGPRPSPKDAWIQSHLSKPRFLVGCFR